MSCKACFVHLLCQLLRLVAAIKIHADYAGIGEWAQLNLHSIQHSNDFGHLSILDDKLPALFDQIT